MWVETASVVPRLGIVLWCDVCDPSQRDNRDSFDSEAFRLKVRLIDQH